MELHHIFAAAVLAVVAAAAEADVFLYQATVWTGTSVAMTTMSQWSIRARVTLVQNMVQVTDADLSVSSGLSTREHYYVPLPSEARQLEQVFALRYDEGKLVGLSVGPGEDVWAVNLKRGLASLLQLDHKALLSPVYTAEENLLHGSCIADYTSFTQNNSTVIRKFVDHETCKEYPWKAVGQSVPILCSQNPQAPVKSSSDTVYTAHTREGSVKLQRVEATSRVVYHLLLSEASHVVVVNQSLVREPEKKPGASIVIPDDLTAVDIAFEFPNKDLSQGRDPASQQFVYDKVTEILKELSRDLDHLQVGADPDEHHKNIVATAIDLLLLAELPTLKKLFDNFDLGTSYQQETARKLFLNILPKVGSYEATLVMRDLIVDKKVDNITAIQFLTYLPFHIREPSEQLLTDVKVLLNIAKDFNDDMKNAVVLSFANLVRITCIKDCKSETLDSYILYFLNRFTGSKKYEEQLLYLDALSNIGIGSVFEYLASIVRGNVTLQSQHPHHLRYRAMWAAASTASLHPQQARELCWPVLMNQSEPLDLRVSALTTLTISDPTPAVFLNVFSYMQSEADPHLYYHYYTTLQSFADSTFPCYKELGSLAKEVLSVARKPEVELWGSGNYILDFTDSKLHFGSIAHLLMIANKQTGFPNIFHFFIGNHVSDYVMKRNELFIRVEGFETAVKQKLLDIMKSTSSIPQLIDMLTKLDIVPTPAEPLHLELAVNLNGCTVLSYYTNFSSWKPIVNGLRVAMSIGFSAHVNSQDSNIVLVKGNYFPTSAGTLAFTRTQVVELMSLRGDIAWQQKSLQTDMDCSVLHSTAFELATYNPILNMWQAAETTHTARSHVVINYHLAALSPFGFKLSLFQPKGSAAGLVWHTRTRVLMKGQGVGRTLRSLCPTCNVAVDVITGNKDKKTKQLLFIPLPDRSSMLQIHVMKCDTCSSEDSIISVLQSALDRNSKNYRILPSSRSFLALVHFAVHLLLAPPDYIEGYSVQIVSTHNQLTELEFSTQLDLSRYLGSGGKGPINVHSQLAHKILHDKTSLWAWDVTGQLTKPLHADVFSINAEFIKTSIGEPPYSVCLQLETELQQSDDKQLLSVRNLLSSSLKTRGTTRWGKVGNDSLSCPDSDGRLDISMTAEVSDEQKELASSADRWPYNRCPASADDTVSNEGDRLFLDPACSQVVSELSTPRRVTADITLNTERIEQVVDPLFDPTAGGQLKKVHITAEFPVSRNTMDLAVNGYYVSSGIGATLSLPWLVGSLLPTSDSISSDWIHTCVINVSNVRTFDKAFVEAAIPSCYVVGTAERAQHPTFAVMVRSLFSTNQLALKIYLGSNYIEIISRNGCTTMSVNDELVSAEEHFKVISSFGLSVNKRGETEIIAPPVVVVYKITSVTITVAPFLQGHLAGLCGDYNGEPSNDLKVHSIANTCPLE